MKRKAIQIARSDDGKYEIYVDEVNAEEIIEYLESSKRHQKRFRFIKEIILGGHRNDCFKREDIDADCRDVYAMRLFVGQENDRIYCKRISRANRTIVVIACELHLSKKDTKLRIEDKTLIRKVASYEYEI